MTDQYPDGKISDDDEGELTVAITATEEHLVINFFKSVRWIALRRDEAIEFGEQIIKRAKEIK